MSNNPANLLILCGFGLHRSSGSDLRVVMSSNPAKLLILCGLVPLPFSPRCCVFDARGAHPSPSPAGERGGRLAATNGR